MTTKAINIDKETLRRIDELKLNFKGKTAEEAIQILKNRKIESKFGFLAKGKKISIKQMMKGLRDKSDRY